MTTSHSHGRTVTLAVLRHREGWKVFGPSGGWRSFDYKVDAEEAALHLAGQVSGAEAEVQVLVQEPWGELRPLRAACYGNRRAVFILADEASHFA